MALLCRVSWLCTVLWICICFPLQEGYNIAHAYHLYESPESSSQFPSGVSLNTDYEDEMETTSIFSPLKDQALATDGEGVSPVGEEMEQRQPGMVREEDEYLEASFPSRQKYEHSSSNHHPFGILVKEHTEKHVEGISFPTINHFKQFIEIMKNAFLTPGSDSGIHFQTAWEAVKNVESSGESNLENEGIIHVDDRKNEVWNGQDASYQMPDQHLSVADPVDSSENLISSNVSDNQEFRPRSAPDAQYYLAATELDLSNLADGDFPAGNDDIFLSAQSTSNDQLELIPFPSGSLFEEDSSFSGLVTASSLKHPGKPSQDFSHGETSSLAPTEQNIIKSKYTSHGKDYLKRYQTPSGDFGLGKDFHRVTQPDVPLAQMAALLNYHGKHLYEPTDRPPKRKIPVKYSHNVNYTPLIYQPGTGSSVSTSSSSLLPQRSHGSVGIQTNIPHEPQMDKSHLVFSVKPSTSLHGTSKNSGYLGYQKDSVTPFTLTEEKSDLYNPNLVSAIEELNDDTISSGTDSPQSGITSHQVKNLMRSFSMPQRQGISPNDINVSVTKMLPDSVNRKHRNFPYWTSELMSMPKGSALNWITARNGGNIGIRSLLPRRGRNMSPLFLHAYIKSSNRYARATAYRSKTRFTPYR